MGNLKGICILVMGVSGSGKSTLSRALADLLSIPMIEADDYHPSGNIQKMNAGISLTDEDREPWLHTLKETISHSKNGCVIACSALKSSYRDTLSEGAQKMIIVYMKGSYEIIFTRMKERHGHFMPASLLKSQFDTLEPPIKAINVNIEEETKDQVDKIIEYLKSKKIYQ